MQTPAASAEETMEPGPVKRGETTALIIASERNLRVSARQALESMGIAAFEAESLPLALELFETTRTDAILVGDLAPDTDAIEICQRIRAYRDGWKVPVLIMTAFSDVETIERGFELGASDFIEIPCDCEVLRCRVRFMLRTSKKIDDLSQSRAKLNFAQRLAQVGSWEWDVKHDVLNWSEAIFGIFHIDPTGFDRTYHSFLSSVHPNDRQAVDSALTDALKGQKEFGIDHKIQVSDGSIRYVHTEAKVLADTEGSPVLVAGTVQDITQRKLHEEKMRQLAFFDVLTGLPNRVLFKENLVRALVRAGENGLKVGVLFIDLDHFKEINDTLGHEMGDRLLEACAERLAGCVRRINRGSDTSDREKCAISRMGGDEFTVIVDDLSESADAGKVAQRIVAAMDNPFTLLDRQFHVTVSIGISIYPDDGTELVSLLRNADQAMYQAKFQGRNQFYLSSPEDPSPEGEPVPA